MTLVSLQFLSLDFFLNGMRLATDISPGTRVQPWLLLPLAQHVPIGPVGDSP